ncbi:sulfate-binding protein [Sphingobacterium sp. Ag1]|uniref:substrate-binding domain-containing protein n=1 Tax=Sphingobacterium sp. Ag1 TaxID=1643451 RepID=UPI000627AC2A|nr:substrate-binding domain-containing protein [Sphingobacterium sp. Ag1]KKO90851.1 sulfate-binding protein [Sphingobacterium sp. Ag1]
MKNFLLLGLTTALLGVQEIKAQEHLFDPPWNSPPESALNFTVPGIDNIPDLYGDIENPQLTIFFAGNQFMVVDDLLASFKKEYPQYERIFVETLPPGILAKQIKGGSITIGNLRITHQPDIYTASKRAINEMADYFSHTQVYCYNNICLMVPKGNPANISTLNDLGKENIRISMPNPLWEGIGEQIKASYKKAGGEQLVKKIMEDKVNDGSTYLTKIHHRESPMRVLYGQADAAPVWSSEVVYQKLIGHPVEGIIIPDAQNTTATYVAAKLKTAPHAQAADDFLKFMDSATAKDIYKKYGFTVD